MTDTINIQREQLFVQAQLEAKDDNGSEAKSVKVNLLANSGKPMPDMWYGQRIYDLEGFSVHKDKLTIDYCHDDLKPIGYSSKVEVSADGLVMPGVLTGSNETSRQVIEDLRAGIPLEASITTEWTKAEVIEDGFAATVNGMEIEGEAVIVREWSLRGVAICPYGNDKYASTQIEESESKQLKVPVIRGEKKMEIKNAEVKAVKAVEAEDVESVEAEAVTVIGTVEATAEQTVEIEDANVTAESTDENAASVEAETEQELSVADMAKPYVEAFGDMQGSAYFVKGLSMEDALKQELEQKNARIAELEKQVDLAKESRGLDQPVSIDLEKEKNQKVGLESVIRIAGARK